MSIHAVCEACFTDYNVKDELAGKKIRCKACGEVFRVPAAGEEEGPFVDEAHERAAPRPRRQGSSGSSRTTRGVKGTGGAPTWVWALICAGTAAAYLVLAILAAAFSPGERKLGAAAAQVGGNPFGGRQVDVPVTAGAPPGDPSTPFPVADVPLPRLPELGPGRPIAGSMVTVHDVRFAPANPGAETAGFQMNLRVYLPPGNAGDQSRSCVLVAPAGTNLIVGNNLDDPDYHDETLPYAEAGCVAIMYSLDGALPRDSLMKVAMAKAYRAFGRAHAGVVNARNAFEFAVAKIPSVNPQRIFAAGHSSAGTAALLFAEHEPRLKGVISYAGEPRVEKVLQGFPAGDQQAAQLLPDLSGFAKRSSPRTHLARINCPVFLYQALDDTVVSAADVQQFGNDLRQAGKQVTLETMAAGGHFESMRSDGIPKAIAWMKTLPGES